MKVEAGAVTYLSKSDGVGTAIQFDSPLEGADMEGWTPAYETNGSVRVWPNGRILEGFISTPQWDTQNERIPLATFTVQKDENNEIPLVQWIANNASLDFIHGMTSKGPVTVGRPLGWKVEKGKVKMRFGVYDGSRTIDECWDVIKTYGLNAGFSIGGAKLPEGKVCDGGKCVLKGLDVTNVAWTPRPANRGSIITWMNKLAKSHHVHFKERNIMELEKTGEHGAGQDAKKRCVERILADPDFSPKDPGQTKEEAAWAVCQETVNKTALFIAQSGLPDCMKQSLLEPLGKQLRLPKNPIGESLKPTPAEAAAAAYDPTLKPEDLELDENKEKKTKKSQSTGDEPNGPPLTKQSGGPNVDDDETKDKPPAKAPEETEGKKEEELEKKVSKMVSDEVVKAMEPHNTKLDSVSKSLDAILAKMEGEDYPPKEKDKETEKEPEEKPKETEKTKKSLEDATPQELIAEAIKKGADIQGYELGRTPSPTGGEPMQKTENVTRLQEAAGNVAAKWAGTSEGGK